MNITELEYQRALKKLQFHEAEADKQRKITQKYHYDAEAERVKQRKSDSVKYYQENPQQYLYQIEQKKI